MSKRLLVLCERVAHEGGIETYLHTILPALASRGWEIRVAARYVTDETAYGVDAEQIPWADEHDEPSADAAQRVTMLARTFAPDVIAMHSVLDADVVEAARKSARRTIWHLHDHRLFCPNGDRVYPHGGGRCRLPMGRACIVHSLLHGCAYGPRPSTVQLLRRRERLRDAAAQSDAFVVFSRFMKEIAVQNGITASPVYVLEPPLHNDWLADKPQPMPARNRILFAGRVHKSKGIESLLRALGTIPAKRRPVLRIAGDGPDLQSALDLAESLRCEVEVLGRLGRVALRDSVDASTLAAVPSLTDEPYALAGIEAFARGRPVAAYDVGGITEWIGKGGIAVNAGDYQKLGQAIQTLLEPGKWLAASKAAITEAHRHPLDLHLDALETAYLQAHK